MMTRRDMLAAGTALAVSGNALARTAPASGLNAVAASKGMIFGSAVAWAPPGADAGSFSNPAYAAILERDCGIVVPENQLKWQWISRIEGSYDFRAFDATVDYATAHGMKVRGHTLFWTPQKWYPAWLVNQDFGAQPAKAAEAMLADHVQTVCRRYGTRIASYDVVNEAVDPATGGLRDTVVTRAMGGGEAFLDLMFHTARAEAPHAELVYNDYMSWERGTEDETHIKGVLALLEGFRKRGTPVDTLGVQSHIRLLKDLSVAEIVKESEGPWRAFLDQVVAMGYRLAITEFDVNDKKAPTDIAVRDPMVADYAGAYLDLMFSYKQLREMLAWGMIDKYSWLTGFDPRADKQMIRGCPYDAGFKPKPLYAAIEGAFRGAPARS
jgi:endo-1,4-beta-xylanase